MKFLRTIFLACLLGTIFSCSSQSIEDNIVLVGVDTLDREGIAKLISAVNLHNPKVIAIDIKFVYYTEYSKDWLLFNELTKSKNLIMASQIGDYSGADVEYTWFADESGPEFLINAKTGFTNAILESDEYKTLKRFSIAETVKGEIEYHFAVRTAMAFDSLKAMSFVKNNPKIIDVDYGNGSRKFKEFSPIEILKGKLTKKDIEGKIVILGFLGPGYDDKFFTPLNTNPNEPDMYGLEYLAHIVAQVLEHK